MHVAIVANVHRRIGVIGAIALACLAAMAVLAAPAPAAPAAVDPAAGKAIFVETCGLCPRLKAAGAVGDIGPDLTHVKLPLATIVKAISNGGSTVMTPKQVAKYQTKMVGYKAVYSAAQIQNIAAYLYSVTH